MSTRIFNGRASIAPRTKRSRVCVLIHNIFGSICLSALELNGCVICCRSPSKMHLTSVCCLLVCIFLFILCCSLFWTSIYINRQYYLRSRCLSAAYLCEFYMHVEDCMHRQACVCVRTVVHRWRQKRDKPWRKIEHMNLLSNECAHDADAEMCEFWATLPKGNTNWTNRSKYAGDSKLNVWICDCIYLYIVQSAYAFERLKTGI